MTPYFFKQMRKRTSLCLVVVLTALAFSLALCMLQRSRDQMAARIEEVYDNLEVRCSVTNLTGTQSDQLNLPDWVLRLFDGEKTYGNFQDNDLFAPYVRDVQVRSTVYCTTPGGQDRLTLSGVTEGGQLPAGLLGLHRHLAGGLRRGYVPGAGLLPAAAGGAGASGGRGRLCDPGVHRGGGGQYPAPLPGGGDLYRRVRAAVLLLVGGAAAV